MSEKRFTLDVKMNTPKLLVDNVTTKKYSLLLVNDIEEVVDLLNSLNDENEQLQTELEFYKKIFNFFADNPMTRYSSRYEMLEEMKLFEKMGLI